MYLRKAMNSIIKAVKREDGCACILAVFVLMCYCVYIPVHLSVDSWSVMQKYAGFDTMNQGGQHLRAIWGEAVAIGFAGGRYIKGIIFFLFALLHKASLLQLPWVNVVAIAFMVASGCKVLGLLRSNTGTASDLLIFLCCVLMICNPFFTDWMQYIECQLSYPMGMYIAICAAEKLYNVKKSRVRNWIAACVLLVIGGGIYQITLQFFVLLAVCLAAKDYLKDNKTNIFWIRIFVAVSVYAISAGIQVMSVKIFGGGRMHANSIQEIFDSLKGAQKMLWQMEPYTKDKWSQLFPIAALVLAARVIICACAESTSVRQVAQRLFICAASFTGFYAALFLPLVVSELWFPQ